MSNDQELLEAQVDRLLAESEQASCNDIFDFELPSIPPREGPSPELPACVDSQHDMVPKIPLSFTVSWTMSVPYPIVVHEVLESLHAAVDGVADKYRLSGLQTTMTNVRIMPTPSPELRPLAPCHRPSSTQGLSGDVPAATVISHVSSLLEEVPKKPILQFKLVNQGKSHGNSRKQQQRNKSKKASAVGVKDAKLRKEVVATLTPDIVLARLRAIDSGKHHFIPL